MLYHNFLISETLLHNLHPINFNNFYIATRLNTCLVPHIIKQMSRLNWQLGREFRSYWPWYFTRKINFLLWHTKLPLITTERSLKTLFLKRNIRIIVQLSTFIVENVWNKKNSRNYKINNHKNFIKTLYQTGLTLIPLHGILWES